MSDVIEAASVRVSTLVDGTLRITADVEPRHAQDAFKLFGAPGVPMALAALKTQKHEAPKGGELCRWAAIRCTEPQFQTWIGIQVKWESPETEAGAAEAIRRTCGIRTRAELDSNEEAAAIFHQKIRLPYSAWLKKQEAA